MSKIAEILAIADEKFTAGTRVTNCVLHIRLPLTERPRECNLCRTDLENQLRFSIRVNEFLNGQLERIRNVALANQTEVSR